MKLYNVIITDQDADVVGVRHFATRQEAEDQLAETWQKMTAKLGGISREDQENYNPGIAFTIYRNGFFRGQVVESIVGDSLADYISDMVNRQWFETGDE